MPLLAPGWNHEPLKRIGPCLESIGRVVVQGASMARKQARRPKRGQTTRTLFRFGPVIAKEPDRQAQARFSTNRDDVEHGISAEEQSVTLTKIGDMAGGVAWACDNAQWPTGSVDLRAVANHGGKGGATFHRVESLSEQEGKRGERAQPHVAARRVAARRSREKPRLSPMQRDARAALREIRR